MANPAFVKLIQLIEDVDNTLTVVEASNDLEKIKEKLLRIKEDLSILSADLTAGGFGPDIYPWGDALRMALGIHTKEERTLP